MKNILGIYKFDMKNIATNWVVALLVGGLIILPSLYAWLNIKASWDPYGQTDQIPVGVVNEDEGALIRDESIHIGNDLVETLRENHSFDWQFVDYDKAMEEVEYGNYYAVIHLPKDFSETLGTVVSGEPEKAQIEYIVNEKINAIAPKITGKGASVIVEKISSQFVATVNGVIFDMFNQIGLEIEAELPDIKQFETYLFTLESELPSIYELLQSTNEDASGALSMIEKANAAIPEAKSMTDSGITTVDQTIELLTEAEKRLNDISPHIKEDLQNIQSTFKSVNEIINEFDSKIASIEQQANKIEEIKDTVNNSVMKLEQIKNDLILIQESSNEQSAKINGAIEELDMLLNQLYTVKTEVEKVDELSKNSDIKAFVDRVKQLQLETSTNIDTFIDMYAEKIEPTVKDKLTEGKKTVNQAKEMLGDIKTSIPKVERLLANTKGHIIKGNGLLVDVLDEFPYVNDKVKEIANRIRKVKSETDLNEIIQLLQNDPEAEQGFFAEPVVLNEKKLFPLPNYGTGMTPFYTVLSIWVGALLLISLLSTELPKSDGLTSKEIYVGRLFTFLTIGLLQTIIVTSGDIFLLGVGVRSKLLFILFGLFISLIFMSIVYTVVSVFGDVGKAMAIVLLVLQIASSGGTFPVVLLPEFFQGIHPFLPFTYAVDLMREAVGGIIWRRALHDILFLSMFGLVFVLAGTFLKGPINKRVHKLLSTKGSRLFH